MAKFRVNGAGNWSAPIKDNPRVHDLGRISDVFARPCHPTNVGMETAQQLFFGAYVSDEREEWAGAKSLADYRKQVESGGKPETVEATRKAAEGMYGLPAVQSIRRRPRYGDEGDDVSMERLYQGRVEDAFLGMHREASRSGKPTHIRIVVNCVASGGVAPSDMVWRGAAAAVMCDKLEEAGYRVQVDLIWIGNGISNEHSGTDILCIRIKDYEEAVDLEHMAATIATPSALRILGFAAALQTLPNCSWGLGTCVNQRPDFMLDECDVYIDNVFNLPDALALCKDAAEVIERGTLNAPEGEEVELDR